MLRKILIEGFSIIACCYFCLAASGDLDATFGNGGKVLTPLGSGNDDARGLALQSDGKIIVCGFVSNGGSNSDFALVRYNQNGSLDLSFGNGGKVITSIGNGDDGDTALAVAVQPDQKIVVAGSTFRGIGTFTDFVVVRYLPNGTLDSAFGVGGISVTDLLNNRDDYARALAIQPNGEIVVGGISHSGSDFDFAIVRYDTDGRLDATLDGDGIVRTSVGVGDLLNGIAVQPDGKILVTGSTTASPNSPRMVVGRYDPNGTLDQSFGTGGIVYSVNGIGSDVAIDSNGKILICGGVLVKLEQNGQRDITFGTDGIAQPIAGTWNAIAFHRRGRIILAGYVGNYAETVRYTTNGSLDLSYGVGGRVLTDNGGAVDIAIQDDGKVVIASETSNGLNTDFAVMRYLNFDSPQSQFDFDSDGKSDISIYRPSAGDWYLQRSREGLFGMRFGFGSDKIIPADYDGDGKTDIAVYRPSDGTWYVVKSSDGTFAYHVFGLAEDVPVPGDFDGDGRADISVFRPSDSTWYRLNSSNGSFFGRQFGAGGDKPVMGDFDGDGKADLALFRPSNGVWYQIRSSDGSFFGEQFGIGDDKIVPADYDGDGKTDLAVYRASNGFWYIKRSLTGAFTQTAFGAAADIAAPGDFDGDGKADICVFRPSEGQWYRLNSSNGMFDAFPFGTNGDRPTQSAFQ